MQLSVYYDEEDQYLVEQKCGHNFHPRALFRSQKEDQPDTASFKHLIPEPAGGLDVQSWEAEDQRIGQILMDKDYVREMDLDRALAIQSHGREEEGEFSEIKSNG